MFSNVSHETFWTLYFDVSRETRQRAHLPGKQMRSLHRGLGCFGYANNIFNKPLLLMDFSLRFDTRLFQRLDRVV